MKLSIVILALVSSQAFAQSTATDLVVPEITVTGSESRSSLGQVPAAEELSGAKLERKRRSSLGETLAHETGVSSSQFGPNASRPVLRGEEGDRVRVLQNGTGVLDASSASQDHAVAVEPLTLEKIEIVRGPGALLYGSSAIGGVVNLVTRRIPEKADGRAVSGRVDSRFSTTDSGRSLGLDLNAAAGANWMIHADASARGADDYHARGTDRVKNSFNRTASGALGASYVFDRGFIGTSFSDYESHYGTVVEEFAHINLLQQRWDLAGELRDLGFFKSMRVKNSFSHYKHDEVEQGGELGTTFKNDGDELRLDLRHRAFAGVEGTLGAQANVFTLSATGEDAFIPSTRSQSYSAFLFEERAAGDFKPSLGARLEAASVEARDDAAFGPGQSKNFTNGSVALGASYAWTSVQSLVLNLAYTARAPNYEELFAKGPHAATLQYEIGDTTLTPELSRSAELSWKYKGESARGSLGAFLQDVHDYISLNDTGATDAASGFEIYRYSPLEARLYGLEGEMRFELPEWIPAGRLELELKVDTLRGLNRVTRENLPRITPVREIVALSYKADRFQTDLEAQRSERQSLTAPNETATDAYTWLNWGLEMPVRTGAVTYNLLARVENIFDVSAKNHVSVIKDRAPLAGRNFILGVQAGF